MKNFTRLIITGGLLLFFSNIGMAQLNLKVTSVVGKLVRTTPKLADLDKTTMYGEPLKVTRDMNGIIGISEEGEERAEAAIRRFSRYRGPSQAMQSPHTVFPNTPITTLGVNFDGQTWSGIDPSDNNIAVGPNHVIQIVNHIQGSIFKIWNKAGVVVQNGTILSSLTGLSGAGDPVVLYDQLADRWLLSEFGPSSCCNQLIVAVSTTGDPTGTWKVYQYVDASFFPDYPKYSVWHNAYYATTNDFNTSGTALLGSSVYAFDRAAMIAGNATATMVRFRQNFAGQANYNMGTVCLEGTTTSSQNGLFIYPDGTSNLGIFELTPNFANPPASIVGPVTNIPVAAYSQPPGTVAQQGTGSVIQTLGSRMMFRMQYRNISGTESIVATHTVGNGSLAAVRWYELRRTGGVWGLYQQGTITGADGNSRFMGSISMDQNGNIALQYDVSGTTSFPSIHYTARNQCDPLGQMTLPEQTIVNGTAAHTIAQRWGDYNTLVSDPSTPGSFWGTSEYSALSTHISNFTISGGAASFIQQPVSTAVCAGTPATFTVTVQGNPPLTYQWQESTNGGGTWNNLTNTAPYSGVLTNTLTINPVTAGMNGYQYRCFASSSCGGANSNAATLTITTLSAGGNITPVNSTACAGPNSTTLTLNGYVGNILRWESSVDGGVTWTIIANTTATYTAVNVTQTTLYRALVQSSGCSAAYSTNATITFNAAGVPALTITADNGTTLCAGDPTLLTVVGAPTNNTVTVGSGPISVIIPDANPTGVTLPLTVAGIPGNASGVSVNFNITHTWDSDLTLFLKAANGQVINLVNAEGGSGDNFTNTTISSASAVALNTSSPPFTGTFAADGSMSAPTPAGFVTTTPTFPPLYTSPNGVWQFGARDNAGGDIGTILNWTLNINYQTGGGPLGAGYSFLWSPATGLNATNVNPVAASPNTTTTYTVTVTNGSGCTANASVLITVRQRPVVTTNPVSVSNCSGTSASFTVAGTGTNLTYQWQESTNAGVTYTNLNNGAPYSGVNTATLTINPVTVAMNNNRYRCVLGGICPPYPSQNNISSGATLTVLALPNVTVTPTSGCGGVAGSFGTALTASGANTYVWSPLTGLYTDATASTAYTGTNLATVYAAPTTFTAYTVTGTNTTTGCISTATALINYTPPAPTVTPNPVTMCLGDPAVRLTSSSSTSTTVSFSSGPISVAVPDFNPAGIVTTMPVSGIPAAATVSAMKVTWNMTHTWDGDMVFALKAPNNQILNLDYYLSGTGGFGATTGFVNTVISSTGSAALSSGTNPYTGTFKADAAVSTDGGPTGYAPTTGSWNALYSVPNGTYTLAMYDGGPGDLGLLTSWKIDITYILGVPASATTWSPLAGLYNDPAALIPYAGAAQDTVYTRPSPGGVYTYTARVNSLPPPPTTVATNHTSGNGNYVITFNFRNSNAYPVTLTNINSLAFAAGPSNVQAWYNATNISGSPNAITNANGWFQFGSATINATGGSTVDPFMSGLSLVVPANTTYRILVSCATTGGGFNMGYQTLGGGVNTFTANGCSIITGDLIGYGGPAIPGVPANTPRGYVGSVGFTPGSITACTSPARTVVVTVNTPISITAQPVNAVTCTDKTTSFTVAATGTTPTYQWQVSIDQGNTFTNVTNGGVYSGATTTTLTITAPPVSMNGYIYRCMVSGAAPCVSVASFTRVLTVNPLPTVVISAGPYLSLFPGLRTTISSTSAPAAATWTWFRNGNVIAGANTGSLLIDIDGLGDYRLRVTDVNGCVNTSNTVTISDSTSGRVFIYPNPNSGQFQVRYNPAHNNVIPRGINVYNSRGQRVLNLQYTLGLPYARMNVDLSNHGSGVYWIEVVDVDGNRLAVGRAEVLR